MTLAEILQDIHAMELELIRFERKYGVLSETFYRAYISGQEPEDSNRVGDFALWAGAFKTLRQRRRQYQEELSERQPADGMGLFKQAA